MISMVMFFAGLTSAYVISMKRDDWVTFELPDAFYISTYIDCMSSITIFISQNLSKKINVQNLFIFLLITFVLGISFMWQQYAGFEELRNAGLFFTGPYKYSVYVFYYWDHFNACISRNCWGFSLTSCNL